MAYTPYASVEYYAASFYGNKIPYEDAEPYLRQASRNIDSLTFNRIVGIGFDNLTSFQKDIIQEVCCQLAEFYYENQDVIDNVLQSYSINGTSMSFGSGPNAKYINGVFVHVNTYALLKQTGLTCRLVV